MRDQENVALIEVFSNCIVSYNFSTFCYKCCNTLQLMMKWCSCLLIWRTILGIILTEISEASLVLKCFFTRKIYQDIFDPKLLKLYFHLKANPKNFAWAPCKTNEIIFYRSFKILVSVFISRKWASKTCFPDLF